MRSPLCDLWVKAGDSFELQPQIVVRAARGGPCIAGIVSRGGPATRCKKISCPYGLRCSLDSTGQLHALSCKDYFGELGSREVLWPGL